MYDSSRKIGRAAHRIAIGGATSGTRVRPDPIEQRRQRDERRMNIT